MGKNRDLIIYADRDSRSARSLAIELGCRRWYETSSPGKKTAPVVPIVVNWGCTQAPHWIKKEHWPWPNAVKFNMLNSTEACAKAIDKLETFNALGEFPFCLGFSNDPVAAEGWLKEDGKVIARTHLRASSGVGLRVVTEGPIPKAPLYTRYYPKTHEFRVHVFKGKVIDFTQKKLRNELVEIPERNRIVRSLANGWIHAHEGIIAQGDSKDQISNACIGACEALGLDFGAVDVLARFAKPKKDGSRRMRDFRICEVNTAPGLENAVTVQAWAKAISYFMYQQKGRHAI